MSKYQELVKSFDNIRKIAYDFFIYGYNGRGDFSFLSERMYDNELRHIKSYLKDFVKTTQTKDKKTISISSNTVYNSINPLFSLFAGKSFTNIDCFLHFALLDILSDYQEKTLSEIAEEVIVSYDYDAIDFMTIRNKLHEYNELGIIKIAKKGKKNFYCLNKEIVLEDELLEAIIFYQNILPAGYIMSPFIDNCDSVYLYKQIFFSNVLDDEYVLTLLKVIESKTKIRIFQRGKKHKLAIFGIPLAIYQNMVTGRRYVKMLLKSQKWNMVRIDKIEAITITNIHEEQLMINEGPLEYLKVTLVITQEEQYVLERIKREVGSENLVEVDANIYQFTLYTHRLFDVIPYVRTYFGRVIDLDCSDEYIIKKLQHDLMTTISMYEEGEEDVS